MELIVHINASICANFFLEKSRKEGSPLTLMKLLKMVYIAHGWSLAILNKGILENEEVTKFHSFL